jgi:hypothetical protein
MRCVVALLLVLACAGCAREARYQMVVVGKGVVRLDTSTGEMRLYQNTDRGLLMETVVKNGEPGLP